MLMEPNGGSRILVPDPSEADLPNADAPIPVPDPFEAGPTDVWTRSPNGNGPGSDT
ncbi:hypothetical protein HAX54_010360, partial [Datura stramonium]|nr:hypothetical protein [Datura stramonium]